MKDWEVFEANYQKEKIDKPYVKMTKELFNTCPFLDNIFQKQEVLFILNTGASLMSLEDNLSDYDLLVITKDNYVSKENYSIKYQGRRMHWYYATLETLVDFKKWHFGALLALVQYDYLKDEDLLWLNPKYEKEWEIFKNHTDLLFYCGLLSCINIYDKWYHIGNWPIPKYVSSKYIARLVDVYYQLVKKEKNQDIRDIEFVKRIKRSSFTNADELRLKATLKDFEALILELGLKKKSKGLVRRKWLRLWK